MPLLRIAHYPEPVLLTVGKPVQEDEFTTDLKQLVDDMFETMYQAGGVGLAAPQVFESRRLFVMDVPDEEGGSNKITFINPDIITVEGEQIGEEGCLSFPGLFQTVQRQMRVIVEAQDVSGEKFELDLKDLAARCVLHETDHCDGIVFLNRMSPLKRSLAKRKIKALEKTGEMVMSMDKTRVAAEASSFRELNKYLDQGWVLILSYIKHTHDTQEPRFVVAWQQESEPVRPELLDEWELQEIDRQKFR